MKISQRIQMLMESKGITKYKLSKELGIHQTTLKNWFDKDSFTTDNLIKIAEALDVSVNELLIDTIQQSMAILANFDPTEADKAMNKAIAEQKTDTADKEKHRADTIAKYDSLNQLGRQKADEYITDLSEQRKYTQPDEE